jgi:molybdenum cofactor cytidylyltransferase
MDIIAVLILAAGKSSRMNGIKQLLKIKNKTLLESTLENAKKINYSTIFCVLGANAAKIKNEISAKKVHFIFNKNFEKGLSSSIICGVNFIEKKHANFEAVLIILADQPEVTTNYLNILIEMHQKNPSKIIVTTYNDSSGVPAIFPKKYFDKLQSLKGDKGAKAFINSHILETIKLQRKKPFLDIDTQEEYLSYLKSI